MRENNAANSGNAVIANPELGPSGLSVETLHGTPRTGEEKVRPGGNKNRQRRAEMTRPLDRWSIELQAFQLSMDFPHSLLGGFRRMATTGTGKVQELVYQIEGDKAPIGHLGVSKDSENLTHPVLVGLSPYTLRGTHVSLPIQGALHNASCAVGESATQMSLNVLQDGFVVVPLGYDGLGEEVVSRYGASFGLIGSRVFVNPNSAISPKETSEFSPPFLKFEVFGEPIDAKSFLFHTPIITPF